MGQENCDLSYMIVDYGMGNLHSVSNALKFLGKKALTSNRPEDINEADAIILPGVGAFGEAMANLNRLKLIDALNCQIIEKKVPFLGICLGMQLIGEGSEESPGVRGLGWIEGAVRRMPVVPGTRLPHIGWNNVDICLREPLFKNIGKDVNFYFVHSYYMDCSDTIISAKCFYDNNIAAAIQKENILATQFHPEKSQNNGLRLLRNFCNFVESKREARVRTC